MFQSLVVALTNRPLTKQPSVGARRHWFPYLLQRQLTTWAIAAIAILAPQLLCAQQPNATPDKRPNIILIMADDIGYECFGCYGSKQYQTPNIDRLASRGVRFTHCYAQPLCTPSRVKLMTGISNVRNYSAFSILNRDQRTIGQYFKEAGYKTMIAGKWQLLGADHYRPQFRGKGTWPQRAGFDESCLWQVDELGSRYWQPLLYLNGHNQSFADASRYGPDITNQYVLDFMARHHDQPFFVYYPMILVHNPFLPTPDSASRKQKGKQRNFEDMVAYMDKMVGRVVKKVEELGIADNTLIMFCGDNGTHTSITSTLDGVKIVGGKGKTTDAGTRVPLVVQWPKAVADPRVSDTLVDFSDFLPTCLEAADIAVPTGLDGHSFLPQLRGEPGQGRQWIYCYYCPRPEKTPPKRFVRDQRWKLYGNRQFFDVLHDPLEQQPLDPATLSDEATQARQKLAAALATMPAKGQRLLDFGPSD